MHLLKYIEGRVLTSLPIPAPDYFLKDMGTMIAKYVGNYLTAVFLLLIVGSEKFSIRPDA